MPTANEQLQANLARIFAPLNESIDLDLKLSVADRDRKEARAEELRREQRADKKADKDIARQEKRDLLRIAIENGVEIPDDATNNQIVKLIKARKEAIATNALKQTKAVYDVDRKRVESRRKELESKREKIINESLSPLQKAQILKGLLTIPEYDKAIRKDSRKKVDELMKMDLTRSTDGEVDSLVRGIYSDIKSNTNLFWFDKGGEKIADAFNMSYNEKVGEQLMASKSAEYAEWQEQMKELSRESQTIERGRSDALKSVIKDHGPYLSDDTISQLSTEAEPAAGAAAPAVVLPDIRSKIADVGSAAVDPKAEPVNPVVEQEWKGEIPQRVKPIRDVVTEGVVPGIGAIASNIGTFGKNTIAKYLTGGPTESYIDPESVMAAGGESRLQMNAKPITQSDVDARMSQLGRGVKNMPSATETTSQVVISRMQEKGDEKPYPMTPTTTFAVIQLAASKHGADPRKFGEFQQKVLDGDKASIALWNQYVEEVQQLEGAPVPP